MNSFFTRVKRTSALALSCVLAASSMVSAGADHNGSFGTNTLYHAGDRVTAEIRFKNIAKDDKALKLAAFDYLLKYDETALELSAGKQLGNGAVMEAEKIADGTIAVGAIAWLGFNECYSDSTGASVIAFDFELEKDTNNLGFTGECTSLTALSYDGVERYFLIGNGAGIDDNYSDLQITVNCDHDYITGEQKPAYKAGDTVTARISVGHINAENQPAKLASVDYRIAYDSEAMSVVSTEKLLNEDFFFENKKTGAINISAIAEDGYDGDFSGEPRLIYTVVFEVKKDCTYLGLKGVCPSVCALSSDGESMIPLVDGNNRVNIYVEMNIEVTPDEIETDSDKPTPTTDSDKPTPTTDSDKPKPSTDSDKPTPTTDSDKPKPSTDSDKPKPSTDSDKPKPSTDSDKPKPSTDSDKPKPSTDSDKPKPSTDSDKPKPSTDSDKPKPSTDSDKPKPSTDSDKPTPSTDSDKPTPSTDSDKPTSSTDSDKPTPSTDSDKPKPSTDSDKPTPSTDSDKPKPSTDSDKPTPSTDSDKPTPSTDSDKPTPSTDSDKPTPSTDSDKPTPNTDNDKPTPDVPDVGKETSDTPDTPQPDEPGKESADNPTPKPDPDKPDPDKPDPEPDKPVPVSDEKTQGNVGYVELSDNTTIITRFDGDDKEVVIPSSIGGKKVSRIDANAFRNNPNVETVILSDEITEIGDSAFEGCENLEQVVIGENVTFISSTAFNKCANCVLYGVRGSYAEQFAAENNIAFVNMHNLIGDINEDGVIDSSDCLAILRFSIGATEFTKAEQIYADSNGDKAADSFDALQVLRYSVTLPAAERIGNPVIEK